MSEKVCQRL